MEYLSVTYGIYLIVSAVNDYMMGLMCNPIIYPNPPLRILEGGFSFFASHLASILLTTTLVKTETMPSPPYTLARLVNSDKPLSHRWYIMFRCWDAVNLKLVRMRDYDVNKQLTKKARLDFAKMKIREINEALIEGYHLNAVAKKERDLVVVDFRKDYSIEKAFLAMMQIIGANKRGATHDTYNSVINIFIKFCKLQGWNTWNVKSLKKQDIISFLDYRQTADGIGNTSRNNNLGAIKSVLTMMLERGIIEVNPALGISQEEEQSGRNIAYQDFQLALLKPAIIAKNERLWLYVQFMFYGFIRPAEIGRMRINMIKLNENVIALPGSITKNRKARNVRISPNFKAYILQLDLDKYRQSDYVFGNSLNSGTLKIQKNFATALHGKIIKELDFGSDYTLYSWKHTGVVKHYKAGIDIKSIQQQLGHSSLQETDKYLKSLDLLDNIQIFDKSPAN